MSQRSQAKYIAEKAHHSQTRRDGSPYINHPKAVVARLDAVNESDDVLAAAWLHDVLEDTPLTASDLFSLGVSDRVVEIVKLLTRTPSEPYGVYLSRIRADADARKIKVADMLHNLSDQPTQAQILKYAGGLIALLG